MSDAPVSKASVLVLSAFALAAAIVAVAWTLGGPAELTIDDDLAVPDLSPPAGLQVPDPAGQSPVQRVDRARFRSESPDGRVQVFSFAAIEPRSNHVSDFTDPRAELYLGQGRVVVIEAASGTFLHPGNDPQRGSFDRDVVVTYYEAPAGLEPDLTDPQIDRFVAFRLFLDETTRFDRDEGRLATQGPIFLTGPAAEFTGRGLNLLYSADEDRIVSMVIDRGERLWLARDATDRNAGPVAKPGATAAASPPAGSPSTGSTSTHAVADASVAETASPSVEADPPWYLARFADDLRVDVGVDEAELFGDALEVVFAFPEDEATVGSEAGSASKHDRVGSLTPGALVQADPIASDTSTVSTASDALPPLPVLPKRSLFTPSDDDVRITWTGPLTLEPLDETPSLLQGPSEASSGEPRDQALLTLAGSPARITVPDNRPDAPKDSPPSTLVAASLAYTTGTGRVEALAQPDEPFRFDAPGQGTLTGQRLQLDPAAANAQADIAGPGSLIAAAPNDQAEEAGATPLDIRFEQRLRLTFAQGLQAESEDDDSPLAALDQLRRARFEGNVHASGRDLQNEDEPTAAPLELSSDVLVADFADNADSSPRLERVTAQGNVLALHADRSLAADDLIAEFDGAGSDTVEASLRLASLVATGRVSALLPDPDRPDLPPVTLTAHRLLATPSPEHPNDPAAGTLVLLNRDQVEAAGNTHAAPARITTPTAKLTAPRLELTQPGDSLDAVGPGRLTQTTDDQTLNVEWTERLAYRAPDPTSGQAATAEAVGNAVATTATPTQAARLEAHRVDLTFLEPPKPKAEDHRDEASDPTRHANPLPTLRLQTAHATADPSDPAATVELTAQSHAPRQPDQPRSRLTLIGPDVFLTQAPETDEPPFAQVTGAGQLFLEDYTEPKAAEADNDERQGGLQLAGQGVTLFQWTERLHVDLLANDLTMHGRVAMNHKPVDDQPNVQLVADHLRADLTEDPPFTELLAGGESPSTSTRGNEPTLRAVQLDGSVIVQQETRRVFADQLLFTADDRNVLLQAYPGSERPVRAVDTADDRATIEADAILWNLDRDRLRITDYRGGLVPIE